MSEVAMPIRTRRRDGSAHLTERVGAAPARHRSPSIARACYPTLNPCSRCYADPSNHCYAPWE
jgi:hypothetical protein